jgi:replicative DNA helicase
MINGERDFHPTEHEDYLVELLLPRSRVYLAQEALKAVEPEDFCSPMHAEIWAAARALNAAGSVISKRGLRSHVIANGTLAEGRSGHANTEVLDRQLDYMARSVPAQEPATEAIRVVKQMGQLRRILETTERMRQRVLEAEDAASATAAVADEMQHLEKLAPATGARSVAMMLPGFEDAMRGGPSSPIVPTPWPEYNEICSGGLHGGRVTVIAGRPGGGKSNLGLILAAHGATEGNHALVFSAEMNAHEVVGRVVARNAGIELGEISKYDLSEYAWRQYNEWKARAASLPLWVDDTPGVGINYIKSVARDHARKYALRVIVIDYLQLLKTGNPRLSREQQVAEMSREIKTLARELDVSVVLLAQLNRESEKRGTPALADLRESGGIEADADTVILIEHLKDEQGEPTGMIRLHLAKNRHGRTGKIDLRWKGYYADAIG